LFISSVKNKKLPVSVVMIAKNEADRISQAIQSASFAKEIIVLDCGSDDRTVEVAKQLGAIVMETDWPGFVRQKNRALAVAQEAWVLALDCDERVSPELAQKIAAIVTGRTVYDGFRVQRRNWWQGRPVYHGLWGRDRPLRLVRKGAGQWTGYEPHDQLMIKGKVGFLAAELIHHPYRSLAEHLQTIDRYTQIAAHHLYEQVRRAHAWDILLRPPLYVLRALLLHVGWLDGLRGICLAWLGALYVLLKWWRLHMLEREKI